MNRGMLLAEVLRHLRFGRSAPRWLFEAWAKANREDPCR